MKKIIIDNFFENPDDIRSYGLSLKYRKRNDDEYFEGKRSIPLYEVNRNLYEHVCTRILGEYYGNVYYRYKADVYFHITSEEDKEDKNWKNFNERVHQDDVMVSGIIFMTPDAPSECGTQTYKVKDNTFVPDVIMSNVYNRMIAYPGSDFHSAMDLFGEAENSRLVILFFLKEFRVQQEMNDK